MAATNTLLKKYGKQPNSSSGMDNGRGRGAGDGTGFGDILGGPGFATVDGNGNVRGFGQGCGPRCTRGKKDGSGSSGKECEEEPPASCASRNSKLDITAEKILHDMRVRYHDRWKWERKY